MKTTKLLIFVGVLFVGVALAFGVPFQQAQHITVPMNFYDNAAGSDYNTMIAEQPSIVIDGYNERIQMGVGGSTAPTTRFSIASSQFNIQLVDGDSLHVGTGDDATITSDATASTADLAGAWALSGTGQLTLEDATELNFGTAAADGVLVSDGTNMNWTITALLTAGDGGTTNYTSISATGAQTWLGSAILTLNDAVEIKFGTAGAESEIASDGTDTTWTQTSGDLVLGTTGFNQQLGGAFLLSVWTAWADSDTTPAVNGNSYFTTFASTQTLTDFDGTGIAAGQIIVVESTAAVTYDVTSSGLVCGDTDVVTADGDVTMWIYNGTDWICLTFMDLDDDANGWGAA